MRTGTRPSVRGSSERSTWPPTVGCRWPSSHCRRKRRVQRQPRASYKRQLSLRELSFRCTCTLTQTLQYLTIPTLPHCCNKYCDSIGHSESQGQAKQSEIVDLQLTNQIADPTIPYNTYNTYIALH